MILDELMKLYRLVGSLTCHQIPSRSLEAGGAYIHVCSRETGIYIGALLSILFIHFKKRTGADRPPALKYGILFCIMFVPLMLDGITSYLGFRATSNEIRVFTGILFGIPLPFLLLPLLNFKVEGNNTVDILKGWHEIVIVTAAAVFLGLAVINMEKLSGSAAVFLVFIISTVIIITQLYLYYNLARAAVSLFWKGSLAANLGISAVVLIICFSFLYIVSHYILQPLRIIYGI